MGSKCFNGEVWTNAHPAIMQAMLEANSIAVDGKVGHDGYSQRAIAMMQAAFHQPVSVMYAYNGTAANILALKSMLRPWDSVLGAEQMHIHLHEDGASEYNLGCKLLTIPSVDGKVTPESVSAALAYHSGYGYQPRVLALTQPTELGVLYTLDELRALCALAHAHGMYVFVDGARITHALAALDTDLQSMIGDTGVDAFTFGGTKAGLMFGEMVVFLRDEFSDALDYSQKQSLQHMDKSKFLGAQFECLLKDEFWRKTAGHANQMAQRLAAAFASHGMPLAYPSDTNMVFVQLTEEQLKLVQTAYDLSYWDKAKQTVRFAATHETTEQMIDDLMQQLFPQPDA